MTKCEFYKNHLSFLVPFKKVFWFILFLVALPVAEGTLPQQCPVDVPLISDMQNIACATADLRKAVQEDDLLRKIGKTDPFASDHSRDVVRSVESLSFLYSSLETRIAETHHQYQQQGREYYTLKIASYPSAVRVNSCPEYKTIDVRSPSVYSAVPDKEPLSFQVVKHRGKFIICERTNKLGNKPGVPPACSKIAHDSKNMCVSVGEFRNLSVGLLVYNSTFEKQYCPSNCSYYTQTIQKVYQTEVVEKKWGKEKKEKKYCSDNYFVVHCGPRKTTSEYNLSIREIKNLCSDFGTCVL